MNVIDQVRDNKQVDQQQKKQRQEKRDANTIFMAVQPNSNLSLLSSNFNCIESSNVLFKILPEVNIHT